MLIEAGIKEKSTIPQFVPVNEYDSIIFDLWQILRHQVILDWGVVIALDIKSILMVLNEYQIYDPDLRVWFLEVLLYISNSIFIAEAEANTECQPKPK